MSAPSFDDRRRDLPEHKRAALDRLLLRPQAASAISESAGTDRGPRVVAAPHERSEPFPLTDVQQAYFVGRQRTFELGNVGSHSYVEIDVPAFDPLRFERALNALIARHEMLRAVVTPDARQQILPRVPWYSVPLVDLAATDADARIAAVRERMTHRVISAHDWPLFEIGASLLPDGRARLHVSFDILIADVQSIRVLTRDLAHFYEQPDTPLEPLTISFRDYVLAVSALEHTDAYRRSEAYWIARLPELPPAPRLPLRRPLHELSHPRFTRRTSALEPASWTAVKSRAQQLGLTPSVVVLAAFCDALARHTESPAFTINLTLYNRLPVHPQIDEVVGDFTSLTLLAVDHQPCEPFEVRARKLQEQLWTDLDHRAFSGIQVLRRLVRLHRNRRAAAMPIVFTSNLLHRSEAPAPRPIGDVVFSLSQTPQVLLDHQVAEEGGALVFNWDAVEEIFPDGLLSSMLAAYEDRLHALAGGETAWGRTGKPDVGGVPGACAMS